MRVRTAAFNGPALGPLKRMLSSASVDLNVPPDRVITTRLLVATRLKVPEVLSRVVAAAETEGLPPTFVGPTTVTVSSPDIRLLPPTVMRTWVSSSRLKAPAGRFWSVVAFVPSKTNESSVIGAGPKAASVRVTAMVLEL